MAVLEKAVVGWGPMEPVYVANCALEAAIIFLGKHGIGKSMSGKLLEGLFPDDPDAFRFYDATKADLIALAGIPSPKDIQAGKYSYIPHNRTIWNAKIVVVDEMSRATKQMQNMWLEILQERTLHGFPLKWKMFMATMNPDTYAGAMSLDEALADRFAAVIQIPEPGSLLDLSVESAEVLRVNLDPDREQNVKAVQAELARMIKKTKKTYDRISNDRAIISGVIEYCSEMMGQIVEMSKDRNEKKEEKDYYGNPVAGKKVKQLYLSRRRPVHLAKQIMAMGAYFMVMGRDRPLERAALEALAHTLSTPLGIDLRALQGIHGKLVDYLSDVGITDDEKLRVHLQTINSLDRKIQFLVKHKDSVRKWNVSDLENELRKIFTEIQNSDTKHMVAFISMARKVGVKNSVTSEAEAAMVLLIEAWIRENMQPAKFENQSAFVQAADLRYKIISGKDKDTIRKIIEKPGEIVMSPTTGKLEVHEDNPF